MRMMTSPRPLPGPWHRAKGHRPNVPRTIDAPRGALAREGPSWLRASHPSVFPVSNRRGPKISRPRLSIPAESRSPVTHERHPVARPNVLKAAARSRGDLWPVRSFHCCFTRLVKESVGTKTRAQVWSSNLIHLPIVRQVAPVIHAPDDEAPVRDVARQCDVYV